MVMQVTIRDETTAGKITADRHSPDFLFEYFDTDLRLKNLATNFSN